MTNVAFGPHISFAGGAAAFAARRGQLESVRDIASPLSGTGDLLPLVVGGLFGMGGYLVQTGLAELLVVAGRDAAAPVPLTDTVALTVAISAIVARLLFGKTGLFGSLNDEARERGRFSPGGTTVWAMYQQGFLQATVLGLVSGLLSAYVVTAFGAAGSEYAAAAGVLMFGVSAVSLILLQFGLNGRVTHHMTLPGAVAAAGALSLGANDGVALFAGAVAGIMGGLLGEFYSRLFLIHGDAHVDPPAFAIFTMATVVVLVRRVGGGV